MSIAAKELTSRASTILQDEDHVRWPMPELLEWINDAARETILRRPSARSITKVLELAEGTLQEIAAPCVQVLDVVRNLGADGKTPGRIVRRIDRKLLDDQQPDWHMQRKRAQIKHYTYDDRAAKSFYVYPPAVAGTKVEALIAELPPTINDETQSIDMPPEYLNAMVNYMVYRALSKDSEYANGQIATLQFQAFVDAVADPTNKAVANSPNLNSV